MSGRPAALCPARPPLDVDVTAVVTHVTTPSKAGVCHGGHLVPRPPAEDAGACVICALVCVCVWGVCVCVGGWVGVCVGVRVRVCVYMCLRS